MHERAVSMGTAVTPGLAPRGRGPLRMHCDILSWHEIGKTWLAQALVFHTQTFAAHLCQACSLGCAVAEDKDNYLESKEVELEPGFPDPDMPACSFTSNPTPMWGGAS